MYAITAKKSIFTVINRRHRTAMTLTVTLRSGTAGFEPAFVRNSSGAVYLFTRKQQTLWLPTFYSKLSCKKGANGWKNSHIQANLPKWSSNRGQSPGYCSHAVPLPESDAIELSPTDVPQRSEEWFSLRRHRLTASAFSTALGFWGDRRAVLWEEKVFGKDKLVSNDAMLWGARKEDIAVERYKHVTGNVVEQFGFKIYHEDDEQLQWLGASPDGLIKTCLSGIAVSDSGGILEVKCPFNKGKPELALPWTSAPYYYMPQIQGLMEILDRNWIDLYCWTPTGSTIFRIQRDYNYWALIFDPLKDFWWENVVPARQAIEIHGTDSAYLFRPSQQHRSTNDIIAQSKVLAKNAPLICSEISGHVQYFF